MANLADLALRNDLAELSPTRDAVVEQGPQRTIRRYAPPQASGRRRKTRAPVLLVPPLGAPISCFDLYRGCSLAEHLTLRGHPTYVVDYGPISFADRDLGLEHWIDDVVPEALRVASADAGGEPVHALGWCLGGLMTALALAEHRDLAVASASLIASPFDFTRVGLFAPVRLLSELTDGTIESLFYRAFGGIPAPLVSLGFRLTALDRYLTRPLFVALNAHDRGKLRHMQAVDAYMASMFRYPGRSIGQLYHTFFRANSLADGRLELGERTIDLAALDTPVLAVAGEGDVLAPASAVHHVADALPDGADVRLETAPGGHLGVLTGTSARATTWAAVDDFLAAHERAAA